MVLTTSITENFGDIMMENKKHALLEDHCLSIKMQQENSLLETIIIMYQDPNTSTIIFTHQAQVLSKLYLYIKNLK